MSFNGIEPEVLMQWVEAVIDLKVEEAFGRDSLAESINESNLRRQLRNQMGLHQYEDQSGSWEYDGS